jgi:hypothetical protein
MVSNKTSECVKKILRQIAKLAKINQKKRMAEASCPRYEADEERLENAANEALEARLALLLATAPPAAQAAEVNLYIMAASRSVRVYTGCQQAGPQAPR